MQQDFIYEVETRFAFQKKEEAFTILPFLEKELAVEVDWDTTHYGFSLFKQDIVLRIGQSRIAGKDKINLGYKEKDLGKVLNVRKEYGEDISNGIKDSQILKILKAKSSLDSPAEVAAELSKLGFPEFMSFQGKSFLGKYEAEELYLKLMYCPLLEYPLLLEVEKEAVELAEVADRVQEINDFIEKYKLLDRLVQEEPPTLLYNVKKA